MQTWNKFADAQELNVKDSWVFLKEMMTTPQTVQPKSLVQTDSSSDLKMLNEEELLNDTTANSIELKTKGGVILSGEAKDLGNGITQFNRQLMKMRVEQDMLEKEEQKAQMMAEVHKAVEQEQTNHSDEKVDIKEDMKLRVKK